VTEVLKREGYIEDYRLDETSAKPTLTVQLKYYEGRPVIERLERVSRPGLRIFRGKGDLPTVRGGLGVAIVSTSNGVMSDREARAAGHGGEVLCVVE
jgi:small subunit ribosomal protein S8